MWWIRCAWPRGVVNSSGSYYAASMRAQDGNPPLFLAAENVHFASVSLLLLRNAAPLSDAKVRVTAAATRIDLLTFASTSVAAKMSRLPSDAATEAVKALIRRHFRGSEDANSNAGRTQQQQTSHNERVEKLQTAIRAGDTATLRRALDEGADANCILVRAHFSISTLSSLTRS